MSWPSFITHHSVEPTARHHPLAANLLQAHDQDSWSITKDGLICAPVGFYRIMELHEEAAKSGAARVKTLVFGFSSESLDLTPHPQHPELKILKHADAYILPPVEADFVKGWAENEMRAHQGQWLDFTLGYGNLYESAKGEDEYFSNNLAAYRLFPAHDEDGTTAGYGVSFRLYPFSHVNGLGLEQDRERSWRDRLLRRGIILKEYLASREEALKFIHEDYRERYRSFLKNEEVQRWADPHWQQGVEMWVQNWLTDKRGKPLSVSSGIAKFLTMAITKQAAAGVVLDMGLDALGEDAVEEIHGNALREIAEVAEGSLAPLNSMKEDVRERCVAVPAEEVRKYIYTNFPVCENVEARRLKRTLDVIHDVEPTIVFAEKSGENAALTARTHYGLEVHRAGDTQIVTYTPCLSAPQPLPTNFAPFFKQDHIAEIRKVPAGKQIPDGSTLFNQTPAHALCLSFKPIKAAQQELAHLQHLSQSLVTHRYPSFSDATPSPPAATEAKPSWTQSFRDAARAVTYYARLLVPVVDARGTKDWNRSAVWCAVGATLMSHGMDQYLDRFETAAPWAFCLSAAYMAKRMGANALTERAKKTFDVAAQALFTIGPLGYMAKEGYRDLFKEADWPHIDEGAEIVGSLLAAGWAAKNYAKKTVKAACAIL